MGELFLFFFRWGSVTGWNQKFDGCLFIQQTQNEVMDGLLFDSWDRMALEKSRQKKVARAEIEGCCHLFNWI